jgi:hypothetical protein
MMAGLFYGGRRRPRVAFCADHTAFTTEQRTLLVGPHSDFSVVSNARLALSSLAALPPSSCRGPTARFFPAALPREMLKLLCEQERRRVTGNRCSTGPIRSGIARRRRGGAQAIFTDSFGRHHNS